MPTNDQDARALTYLARRIRQETHCAGTWDEAGTYAVIAKMLGHNLPTVVERVTRHAGDPKARTPGAIERPFIPDAPSEGSNARWQPTPGPWCGRCGVAKADHRTDADHEFTSRRHPKRDPGVIHQIVEATKAELERTRPVAEPPVVTPDPRADVARAAMHATHEIGDDHE